MQLIKLPHQQNHADTKSASYTEASVSGKTYLSKVNSDIQIQTDELYNQSKDILLKSNPGKLLYSIRESASVLGVSYEFVRQKIQSGDVITTEFSTRKMVHLNELTKLIISGIH